MLLTTISGLYGQCDAGVPAFVADLRGNPDSVWISPSVSRQDNCCGTSNPDRCIKFTVYLDSLSQGIRFDFHSGAVPSGSLFYQIGCGPSYAVGADICLNGVGPHVLTFCKPGNNQNEYSITAIPAPQISPGITVSMACVGKISVSGLVEDSITWESVPYNATYNSFLNCTSGCDSVTVTPSGTFPDSISYRACGPISGGCAGSTFCDTVTVYFVTDLGVQILPQNPTICFGDTATTIMAHGTGGLKPYKFYWSHIGGSGLGDSVQYVDTGTYIVSLLDSLGCSFAKDTVVVTGYSSSILALAGIDTFVCRSDGVLQLNGEVQQATGGIWSGTGTFSPSATTLNANYTLSASDLLLGQAALTLITTGNGTCPADTDVVIVTVEENPPGNFTGPDTVCQFETHSYLTSPSVTDSMTWSVSGGSIVGTNGQNEVFVRWDTVGIGTITLYRRSNQTHCDTTVIDSVQVFAIPQPLIAGPDSACEFETVIYSLPFSAGETYSWSVSGGAITSGQSTNSVNVFWNSYGTGIISVSVTNANGCDSTVIDSIFIVQKPTPSISGFDSSCSNKIYTYSVTNVLGNSYSWAISNGTIVSGQGTNSVTVFWDTVGTGIITLTQTSAFGCDSTIADTVVILYTPAPVISGPDTACHNSIMRYSVPAVDNDTYFWSVNNGTIISGQGTRRVDVLWGVGLGVVTLTQSSPLGCDSTVSDSVVIIYTPAPVISGSDTACNNKIYTFSVPAIVGDTYTWSVNNGSIISGQGTNNITAAFDTVGIGTVTLTQISPAGCDSTVNASVVVLYTPAPVISGPDTACHNKIYAFSAPVVVGDIYTWSVNNGSIISGQGTNSITAVFDTVGTGTVTLTQISPAGCDSTVSVNALVLYTPAPVISGPDTTCHNKVYTFNIPNVVGDTYSWSVTNGAIITGQGTSSIDVMMDTAGTGIVSVTQTSPLGCDSTVSTTITILYTPAPVLAGNDTVCHNKITTYTVANIAGDSYSWNVTNGTIISGQNTNTVDVLWGTAGTGTVSITQTSPLGCDSTVSSNITILYTPSPIINGTDSTCHNNIYTYSTPSVAGDSYLWSVINGTIITGQNTNTVDILWGIAGSGSVSVTQTSPLGCDSTVLDSIVILYTPAPLISGSDSTCQNKIYSYSVSNVVGDAYNWSVTNGIIIAGQGTNSIDVMMDTVGTGIVTITQTSPLGCDSTITDTITVIYTPAPVLNGADTVCHNKISTYSVANIIGDIYVWNVTNGTIITGQNTNTIDVLWGTAGTGTVGVTQTSPLGCDSTLSATITILYTPAPIISGSDSTCHNNIYSYTTPSVAGDTYAWNVTNGTIISGQNTNTVDVLWGIAGTGTVSVTQTSPLGCDSTLSTSITILYTPAPVINGADTTCQNKIYTYTTAMVAGDSYNWIVTNGVIISGQGTNSIDVMLDTIGSSVISITQTSPLGCDSAISDTVTVIYTPVPLILGDDSTCHNKITTYTVANIAGDSYSWNVTNGTIISGQNTNTIDVLWGTAGTGIVSIIQTSPLGCDSTLSTSITILYTPAPVINGADTTCQNKIYTYTTVMVAGDSYNWTVTNGTIIAGQGTNSIDVMLDTIGSSVISITQTSPLGCDSTITDTIVVIYTPAPVLNGADTVCHNKITTYTVPNIIGDTYVWNVTNGSIVSGQNTNTVDVLWGTAGNGSISVTQTSPLGCDSTLSTSITILYTPAPVINGADTTCQNKIYTYTTAMVAGDSYNWTVTNGVIISGQGTNSIDVMLDTIGSSVISITQTSPLGCDSTITDTITVIYTPAPIISGSDSTCHNNIYTYTTPSVVGDSYNWIVANGTIVSGQNTNTIDVLWGTAGTGIVSITQTSPLGCDSTVSSNITILYTPAPAISGLDTTCQNKIYTYTTAMVAGDSYNWTVTNGTIISGQGTNSIDVMLDTIGSSVISITQTSPLGCDSTITDTIVVIYTPAPVLNGADTVCHNKITTHTVPNIIGDTYAWNVTNGTIITGQNTNTIDVLWGTAGAGTVSVTQTSPLGCDSTVSAPITILYTPVPVITGLDSTCHNNIYTYSTPVVAGDSYLWSVTNGTIIAGQNTNTIDVLWGTAGSGSISVTQTSPLGCDSTVLDSIVILYTPAPVINGADTTCQNKIYTYTTAMEAGDSYIWTVTNGTIISGQGTNSIDVMLDTIGSSVISITQTSPLGCDSTITDTIVVIYTPAPVLNGADTVCHNKITTYSVINVLGDTYSWVVTNGTITSGQNTNAVDVLWGTAGNGSISVTQTSPLGCDSTLSAIIAILYTPAPVITGVDSACQNKIYTYSVPAVSGDAYNWVITNGAIISGQGSNTVDVMLDTIGTSTVTVTQISPLGCDSTVTDTITVIYTPVPVLAGDDTVCHNKIHTYTTTMVVGDSYNWAVVNGTIVSGQNTNTVDVLWGIAGNGSISVTQTSSLGCDSTVSSNITILYTPVPLIAGPDTACQNKIYTYSIPNVLGDTYSWVVTNGTIIVGQGTNSIDVMLDTVGTSMVTVTQTSPLGCDSTVTDTITIIYTPAPVLSGVDTVCHNKITTYSVANIIGDTYVWNVTNGTIVSGQNTNAVDVLWGTAGNGSISVTQTSPLGCDSTLSTSITILYTPAPVIIGADTTCQNKIYTYTTTMVAGDSYNWTVTNGTIIAGQGTNSIDVMLDSVGSSVISITQTSPLGCDSIITDTIGVVYTPAPVISGSDTSCHNDIKTYAVPNVPGDTYSWVATNGTIIAGQGTNTVDVVWGIAGVTGSILVTQTSPFGCDSTAGHNVVVVLYTPAPVIMGNDSVCDNNIYTYSTPAVSGDSYSWTVTGGTILSGQNTNTINVIWNGVGVGNVTVNQVSPLGCDSTLILPVWILYTPAPIITGIDTACRNKIYTYSVPNVGSDVYSWSVTNGTIIAGQGTNSIDVMLDTIGSSIVTVTQISSLGCDSTIADTITVIYTPAPILNGADTVCHNKITTYSVINVLGDTYSWVVTNGIIISGQNTNTVDVLWGTAGNGNISVTQTSPLGCDSTLSTSITILYTPAPVIIGADTTCQNKIYTYTTTMVAGDSYNWTVTNGTIIAGQGTNSIDVMLDSVGSSVISITQTSPLGCDSIITDTIGVVYTPTPVITGSDTTCHNKIQTYSVPFVPTDSYTWSVNGGTIITGQTTNSIDVLWGTAGTGNLSVTQTSASGCDSTVGYNVVVILYTPSPVIAGNGNACHNKPYNYGVTPIAGDSYNWVVTNGTIVTGQGTDMITILWDTVGTGTVSITQTSPLGCDSTLSTSITILYTPAPVINGADTACQNKIYTYTTAMVAGDSYNWTVINGTIISGQGTNSIDVMLDTIGSSVISITQTSPLGCDSTIIDTVTVIYTPAPVLNGADTVCHNKITTYIVPNIIGDTYVWNVTNGTIISGQNTNTIDVLWGIAGTGTVSITQTSPLGCDSTVSSNITILYTPAPVINGADTTCQNKIYTYTTAIVAGDSYNWTVTNGTIIGGQGTNSIDVMLDTIGSSIISITQTSPLGCDSTVIDTIEVIYTPAPVLSGADTVCHNKITTYIVPNIIGDTYVWNVTNGTIISGQNTNTVDVLWGTAGNGSISVTQTSPLGCDSTLSTSITILYTPVPDINGADTTCQNKIYTYTTAMVAGDSYNWTVTNGAIIAGQGTNSIDVMLDTIGLSIISVTQTSPLGCDSTITDTIVVIYTPAPVLSGADTVCHNKISTYSVVNIAGDNYNWAITNGTIISGQNTNTVDVLWGIAGTGTVSVTQTSPLGCDSTVSSNITILYTPAPVINGADTTCQNKIYTYTTVMVAGDSYNWTVTNGAIIAGQGTNSIDVMLDTIGSSVISITQTSPLGCDSTITDTIVVIYTPAPVLNGADTVCHNKISSYSVTNIAGDSYNWIVTNGAIITGQNTNTIDVLWGIAGTGTVSITQTSPLGCDSTVSSNITILYTPAPVINGADTTCQNKIYTYTTAMVAGDSYNWTVTNGTIIGGQGTNSIDVMLDTIGSSVISITQTSPLGCDSTISDTVTVIYTPAPVLAGDDTVCHNKINTYSVVNIVGDTYVWNVTNGTIISGQNTSTVDVLWGTAGNGSISVTQTSPLGCDSTLSTNIAILYTPSPVLSGDDTVCHSNIHSYSVPFVTGDTFTWAITNGTILAGQGTNTVDVLWGVVGAASISVTQASPLGCDSTVSATITILYTPAPVIAGADTVCHNKIYTYTIPDVIGDSYNWTVTNGTIISGQGTNSIDVMLDSVGSGVISITQTSPLGCDSTVRDTVKVIYTPVPILLGDDTICRNSITTYTVPFVIGDSYSWVVNNGVLLAGQGTNSIDVLWNITGLGNVHITQASPEGCDSTITASIVILYTPAPMINGVDSACHNKIYTYTTSMVAGDSYNWVVTNGTIISGQGTNSIDVMLDTVGNSIISITQTSPLGCDSTVTDTIKVIYTPAPFITGPDTSCHNKILSYSTPFVPGDNYNWVVNNGSIVSGQGTNSIDILWGTAGINGSISVTQTSASGCDSTVSYNVVVILYTPAPVISGSDSACEDKLYTYSVSAISGDSYNWSISNGTIISGQNTNVILVQWDTVGMGVVTIRQTSVAGCDSVMSDTVSILRTPNPIVIGSDTVCHNKIYGYSVTPVAGNTYNWNVTNGTILSGQNTASIIVRWGVAGISTLTIRQTTPLGCDSVVTDTITILYSPAPAITGNDSVCHNKIYNYSVANIAGDIFSWNVTNGSILSGQGTNSVSILWGSAGVGNVFVTQTSSLGCDSTVFMPIRILYSPVPVISGLDTVCHNKIYTYSTTNISFDSYNWSVVNGTIISGQGTSTINVRWGASGVGRISLLQTSALGCDSLVHDSVTILYSPAPAISGNGVVCYNQVHTYRVDSVGTDTYQWQVTGGTILAGQGTDTIVVQWHTTGNGNVRITQRSVQGCDSTISLPVIIRYRPTPQVSGTTLVCSNKIVNYSTTAVSGDSYVWTAVNGTIIAGQGTNSVDVMWNLTDTGYIYVNQISPLGCDSMARDTVFIRPSPVPVINGNDTVCHNKLAIYTVDSLPAHTYLWTVTNGTILSGQATKQISVLWGSAGIGTVRIEQHSDLGCDSIMTRNVLIQPSPAPVITGLDTVCHNKIYQHSVISVAGNSYRWSVTNGTIVSDSLQNTVSVMWGSAGKGYIQILQTNQFGCDSILTDSVVIVGSPNPQINGPDTVCHNKITTYFVTPALAGNTYQWTVVNGTILSGQATASITVRWGTSGIPSSVRVRQTNQYGCDSSRTLTIHVDPTPRPIIQGNTNICSENFEYYSITPQNGHTYAWVVTGGALMSPPDSAGARVNWGAPGTGTVRVTQTNQYGCDSSFTLPVIIRQGPIRTINGPDTTCVENAYNYFATNAQAGDTYTWTVAGGTIQGAANNALVNVLWNAVGWGRVTLNITNSFGCDSVFTVDVNVFDLPRPDMRGNSVACNNTKNNLFKDYKYNSIQSSRFIYAWSISGGGIITTPTDIDSILVDWLSVGTHNVNLTITDRISGCVSSNTFPVVVDSLHAPSINTSGVSGCSPFDVTFTESQNNNSLAYQWQIDGLGYSTALQPQYTYHLPGTYNARIIVTNAVGCVDTAYTQVIVRPSPKADFIASKNGVYTYEQDTAYFTNTSTGAVSYVWSFDDTTTIDTNFNTQRRYSWPGEYLVRLRVENEYGCPDSIEKKVQVIVKPILYVPNAITPNGDNNNDYFEVSTYFVTEMKVIIFNRWGEIIFRSEDVYFKWDGTYEGYPVQQDVYAYYIVARGFNKELLVRSGNITVLR